jgi:HEPN domain-containing protein
MINKSDENLEAAKQLLETGLTNAAASRAYYSAYHACWWILNESGASPDKVREGQRYWSHENIAEQACLHGPDDFSADLRDDYNDIILQERIVADYFEEDVGLGDLKNCIKVAERILEVAGGREDE